MSDYKELIKQLRMFCLPCHGEEKSIGQSAADVIEHLQSKCERLVSDYEILAKMYAKVNEELCVRTKERDAAVADIEEVIHDGLGDICTICTKYKSCMKIAKKTPLAQPPCERGKWRGVGGGRK